MHDPMTTAFEIRQFWRKARNGYKPPLATIWHVDPERDGTDDSCGWFMRSRHGNNDVLAKIIRRFSGEWTRQMRLSDGVNAELGLFDGTPYGWPAMSIHAIALNLFFYAAFEIFRTRDKAIDFMRKHLCEILIFAENPVDSLHEGWMHKFGLDDRETQEDRVKRTAGIIYGWILRESRPWYRHPRWHFWHWKIQIHPLQNFKRWAFSRCEKCGKRFAWGYSPCTTSWNGTGPLWFRSEKHVHHSDCANAKVQAMAAVAKESDGR